MANNPRAHFLRKLLPALGLALLHTSICHAEQPGADATPGALTLKGFGTLGIARSDNDSTEFVRDLSQPSGLTRKWTAKVDSLIGLQAGLKFDGQTEGVVQAISRYRFDGSYRPEITWAFLRREIAPDIQVRLGRLGTEFFMLADSRLVGFANLTVRPPPDYYGPLVFSYFDGLDASSTHPVGPGLLRSKLFAGYAAEQSPLSNSLNWDLRGSRMLGGHLDYVTGPWQLRVGHAQIRFKRPEPISELAGFDILALAPELSSKNKWAQFDSLGVVYDNGPVQVQAMLNRIDYGSVTYENSRAGYVIASYRLPQLTPYVGYSRVKSVASPFTSPLSAPLHQFLAAFVAETHSHQHTITVGTRWDLRQNMALKAQFDTIRGEPDSVFPFRGLNSQWNGHMKVFSLTLDFVF